MGYAGYWRIIRPVNSFVAGFAVLLGYLMATGTLIPQAFLLIPVVLLITAAGNVINDYCDREIDAINRPKRPIPAGTITPSAALRYSFLLFVLGIAISAFSNPLCFFIAVFNSVLLVAYALRLKAMPLIGNVAVAYLAASIFLFGGALAGMEGLVQNTVIALITFCAMLARELLKDAEDVEGDREGGAMTLPLVIGVRKTGIIAFCVVLPGIVMSYLPVLRFYGFPYLVAITIANIVIFSAALRALCCGDADCIRATNATTHLKCGMFLALLVFLVFAILF